jgi:hypothetical protein
MRLFLLQGCQDVFEANGTPGDSPLREHQLAPAAQSRRISRVRRNSQSHYQTLPGLPGPSPEIHLPTSLPPSLPPSLLP